MAEERICVSLPLHPKTVQSQTLKEIREQPQTYEELGHANLSEGIRQLIRKLKPPKSGTAKSILYLYGDERRAIRRFLEVNQQYVASEFKSGNNALRDTWSEPLYEMLLQEYQMAQEK